ncbi:MULTISPECIES: hypothetical protein [Amycolatopsis]|uniref:Neocarzinostatin family protein n=1 Tax=Amycolatopsis rubida TaxID=112413 RepID=A0A1I6AP51_9PSEU|nr:MULTISPECIES: hypothetical protein [Amycolatopsis]OAP20248.1 hypothetical protein A4R44_09002 [Amycolatopsis sp. M39]SFQ70357.1 hypothetical protein SAMN05421854_12035 [Amycolatopsis rubida]
MSQHISPADRSAAAQIRRKRQRRAVLGLVPAAVVGLLLGAAGAASAASGTATHNGHTLTASNATGLAAAGETITVTGSGYDPAKGYYLALCQVPDDYSYGQVPSPCAGGDGQGSTGVGPSAWVTNSPVGGSASTPIDSSGGFSARIRVKQASTNLDCATVTCAVVSRRDHLGSADRSFDVFIPVSFS